MNRRAWYRNHHRPERQSVVWYNCFVKLMPDEHRLTAQVEIIMSPALARLKAIEFLLNPALRVQSIESYGKRIKWVRKGLSLALEPPPTTTAERSNIIKVYYEGYIPPPRESDPDWTGAIVLRPSEVRMTESAFWTPVRCLDIQARHLEATSFKLNVTLPTKFEVAASARYLPNENEETDTLRTWTYDSYCPGLISLGGGVYFSDESSQGHGVLIRTLLFDHHTAPASYILEQASDIVAFYSDLCGPFPWDGLTICEMRVANPTCSYNYSRPSYIFCDGRLLRNACKCQTQFANSLAHEIAHQWWGNCIRQTGNTAQGWLSEGLAEYSALLYIRRAYGSLAFAQSIGRFAKTCANISRQGQDIPLHELHFNTPMYGLLARNKGALAFHSLHVGLGDDDFSQLLRSFYTEFAFREVTTEDFLRLIRQMCGHSRSLFFQDWLSELKEDQVACVNEREARYCGW